jgi:uncharacterized protein YmfQ (DUF2313 family)
MCALELFNTVTRKNRRVHKNVRTAALRLASPEYLWVWHIISNEFQVEGSKICHDQAERNCKLFSWFAFAAESGSPLRRLFVERDHPISPRQI